MHRTKPIKNGDWEYVKEKSVTATKDGDEDQEELDNIWEDMDKDELDDLDPVEAPLTVPLIDGNAAAIKQLSNNESVENLGL